MPETLKPEVLLDLAANWGLKLLAAVIIFVVGRFVSKILLKIVTKMMSRASVDEMLVSFFRSIVNVLLLLVVSIMALRQLGVDTTSLIALLGAAGLAIGLALQDSLKNFASGVMLIIFRPFSRGDFVETAGVTGTVEEIRVFSTRLRTPDNREVIIPNGAVYSGNITNFSSLGERRVDMVFGVGYEADLQKARRIIQGVLDADHRVLTEPTPDILVAELADNSVNFYVRPWAKAENYWNVKFDITVEKEPVVIESRTTLSALLSQKEAEVILNARLKVLKGNRFKIEVSYPKEYQLLD